jgi:rRNA biogenesis protein RRP5
MKFSSKKMKFFFKRFLAFEKEHGDKDTIAEVKKMAQEYIESVTQVK